MHYARSLIQAGTTSAPVPGKELAQSACFTTLRVRRSLHSRFCSSAVAIAKQDWSMHASDNRAYLFPATENDVSGNWTALVMPDAIPFRLGLMTYAAHMIFLHEDVGLDGGSGDKGDLNEHFVGGLAEALPGGGNGGNRNSNRSSPTSSSIQRLLAPFAKALLDGDRKMGSKVLQAWHAHYLALSSIPPPDQIRDVGTYLTHRATLFGTEAWATTLHYALGIHLSESELEQTRPAVEAAMRSVVLTTDYHRWPAQSQLPNNTHRSMNAVAFAMGEYDICEQLAEEHVKQLATEAEEEFVKQMNSVRAEEGGEVAMYLGAVENFAAGNSLWCATCPRFHGF